MGKAAEGRQREEALQAGRGSMDIQIDKHEVQTNLFEAQWTCGVKDKMTLNLVNTLTPFFFLFDG